MQSEIVKISILALHGIGAVDIFKIPSLDLAFIFLLFLIIVVVRHVLFPIFWIGSKYTIQL